VEEPLKRRRELADLFQGKQIGAIRAAHDFISELSMVGDICLSRWFNIERLGHTLL